jgi:molybdopterin converting factor small subunit
MKIKVKLYTILEKYAKGKVLENNTIILHKDTTLQGLSHYLDIPDDNGIVFLVNDSLKDKEFGLHEGDEVKIFSFIAGG